MDIFPTQYSLLASTAINHTLQQAYGLQNSTCKFLIHNISDIYKVEDAKNRYIFKIYRTAHRTFNEIEAEVELLNILKDKSAKVAYPIPDLHDNYIQTFNAAEGVKCGVLFSYADGQVFRDLNEKQLTILGREMAVLHNITSNIKLSNPRITYNIQTTITNPLAILKSVFESMPNEYTYLTANATNIVHKLNRVDLSLFSYGYCHYDFLPKNFHFNKNDEITFFDFDFAGEGFLANDITSFYIHLFLQVNSQKITQQQSDILFDIFVKAYRTIRPLSADELKAIPYLGFAFLLFDLAFQSQHFEEWSNFFFKPQYVKGQFELIKTWVEWYC